MTRPKKSPVLRAAADAFARVSFNLPPALHSELRDVRAAARARGLDFPADIVVAEALRRALTQARAELDAQGGAP